MILQGDNSIQIVQKSERGKQSSFHLKIKAADDCNSSESSIKKIYVPKTSNGSRRKQDYKELAENHHVMVKTEESQHDKTFDESKRRLISDIEVDELNES